jgi:hypothetical protein
MAFDFKFVPVSGPISGVEVLRQIEMAINELGAIIDRNTSAANRALEIAQNAQKQSSEAAAAANGVADTAGQARAAAMAAVATANAHNDFINKLSILRAG